MGGRRCLRSGLQDFFGIRDFPDMGLRDSALLGRCDTVPKKSRHCRTAHVLDVTGQSVPRCCEAVYRDVGRKRHMLWGIALVWIPGFKRNWHLLHGTQLATSIGTNDLYQEGSSKITSSANTDMSKPHSKLFSFPMCFCNFSLVIFP